MGLHELKKKKKRIKAHPFHCAIIFYSGKIKAKHCMKELSEKW